jgi:hypothetical protein
MEARTRVNGPSGTTQPTSWCRHNDTPGNPSDGRLPQEFRHHRQSIMRRISLIHNTLRVNPAAVGTARAYGECQMNQHSPELKGIGVMKRVAWILTVLGIFCVASGQAQAEPWHHGGHYGGHPGYYCAPHHGGFCGPVVVQRPIWVAPRVVVPVAPPPAVMYPPVYRYRYYQPVPAGGFYYSSPGLSIGIGW